MVKSVLKKIFPILFLKDAYLFFNQLKIRTWDKIFFPEKIIPQEKFLVKEEKNPFLENQLQISHFEADAQKKLQIWLDPSWKQDQYFLHYKESAFLEPHVGWGITHANQLIYPSLGFSRAPYVPKPRWSECYLRRRKVINIPKLISLRDTGEENYFHFYNDVLAKLFYIQDNGFDIREFTIVLSEELYKKQFFQFFFQNTWLKELKSHIQRNEWIHFEEAIFCKPYTHTKKYLDLARNLVQLPLTNIKNRRIFLTRSRQSLRFIENIDEISYLLKENNFEIIDAANISVSQQIEIFSECEYLISIHGAGLVNTIFRQGMPLTILEIVHPFQYIPFHYMMIAKIYGYHYQLLLGERGELKHQGGFRINHDSFKQMLGAMVSPPKKHKQFPPSFS